MHPTSLPCRDSSWTNSEEYFAFLCDYTDQHAELIREYILYFYPIDNSVEMFDTKQRRKFIKRSKYPSLSLSAFILGNSVTVFSRQLYLRDYADESTRSKMTLSMQQIHILIPEMHIDDLGSILSCFSECNGIVKHLCLVNKTHNLNTEDQTNQVWIRAGKKCAVAHIVISNEISLGSHATTLASKLTCILSKIQESWQHVSQLDSLEFNFLCSVEKRRDASNELCNSLSVKDTSRSIMVIKPHAILEGLVGKILHQVQASGLQLCQIQTFVLTRPDAQDFLEIYKGVIPEYYKMVEEFISGPLVACEVGGTGNVVAQLRHLSGPYDPELGQVLYPSSIRAKFGHDKIKNAVHCTDLVQDADLETMFFFQLVS